MLSSEEIFNTLKDWNIWFEDIDKGINREYYLKRIHKLSNTKDVVVVKGVRRAGKSTILRQFIYGLIKKIDKKQLLFINFEDSRFAGSLSLDLIERIFNVYLEYMKPKGEIYVFLDEVQNIPGWEKWVRTKHELKQANIFVTGSSSKLLGKEFGTALSGRYVNLTVYPLSFTEFLNFRNLKIKDKKDMEVHKIKIKQLLREYLLFGGFPKITLTETEFEKKQQLSAYFESILLKDIVARHNLKSYEKLKKLAVYLLTNISKPHTINSLKNALNLPYDTSEKYFEYMKDAYLVFDVYSHTYSLKEQYKLPRKVYCIDIGLRNITSFAFSQDIGRLCENAVFLELKRKEKNVFYWKDKQNREVDFVVKEGLKAKELIQVSWDIKNEKTKKREIRSLLKAMKEFRLKECLIITEDDEGEETVEGKKIRFMPLWKWLLKN